MATAKLIACRCCGQIQGLPAAASGLRPFCVRCDTALLPRWWQSPQAAAALALSALIFYVPAILLPMMRLESLGHSSEASIIQGVSRLLADRHYFVGIVVLVFSLILPPVKLLAVLLLASGWLRGKRQARLHHAIEVLGRWSMLDVLVIAVLVAFVKLGDMVSVEPGAGLILFISCVIFSLMASACLHLPSLWKDETP